MFDYGATLDLGVPGRLARAIVDNGTSETPNLPGDFFGGGPESGAHVLPDPLTTMTSMNDMNTTVLTWNSSNTTLTAKQPEFVDLSRSIVFYSLAFIIPMGLICNTMSICVFMSKPLRMRAASWYLAALAVSDDLSLLTIMTEYWLNDHRINLPIVKNSDVLCVMVTHFSYVSRLLSAWLVMTFTIERFIGVVFPLKRAALSTTAHARKVILCECITCVIVTSYTIFTIRVVDEPYGKECDVVPDLSKIYLVFNIIFLVFGSIVIPILIICTLNMFILHKVYQRKRLFTPKNLRFGGIRQAAAKANRDFNVATLLLVVSTTFVILNSPYCVSWFLLFIEHTNSPTELRWDLFAAKYITSVPYYLNYSINFALYSLCARAFRQSVAAILTCRNGCCACCRGRDGSGFMDTKHTVMEFYMDNRNIEDNGHRVVVAIRSKSNSKSRSISSSKEDRKKPNQINKNNNSNYEGLGECCQIETPL